MSRAESTLAVIDSAKYAECVSIVLSLEAETQERVGMGRRAALSRSQISEMTADELVSASLDGCEVA